MKQKQLKINGLEITYLDNESKGLPLILLHGNSLSASLFKHQFEDEKLGKYRLIAPDLPGHGKSPHSADPENDYSVKGYIKILAKFIERIMPGEFAIFGHSLGGHIAINLLPKFNKCKGLIALGTPPLKLPVNPQEAFLPSPFMGIAFKAEITDEEKRMLAAGYLAEKHAELDSITEALSATDPMVRPFIGKSITNGQTKDETVILKKSKDKKIALVTGENDKIVNINYIRSLSLPLWTNDPLIIKNGSHSAFLDLPVDFNALLVRFLDELSDKK